VVADIDMPVLNGIQAARVIRRSFPGIRVVILSFQDDPIFMDAAFEAGARGYVLKSSATETLIAAIHAVLQGRLYRPSQRRT
jgi:DNA-binding NarL/FixJ family response regulator